LNLEDDRYNSVTTDDQFWLLPATYPSNSQALALERVSVWSTANLGTISNMDNERLLPSIRDLVRLIFAIIGVIAIVQELRKPAEERQWNGKVADVVPYDFRMPTVGRMKNTYWNPEGSVLSGKVFGVGWAPNFGVLVKMLGDLRSREDAGTQAS